MSETYWRGQRNQQVQQGFGGTGLTQGQRDKAVAKCMEQHGY